jgi:hypothetical protein
MAAKSNIRVSWYESRGRRAKTLNTVQRTPKFDADYAGKGKWKVRQQLINLLIAIRDNVFPKINHFELAWCSPVDKQEEEKEACHNKKQALRQSATPCTRVQVIIQEHVS